VKSSKNKKRRVINQPMSTPTPPKKRTVFLLINDDDTAAAAVVIIVNLYYSMAMTHYISNFSCKLNRIQPQGSICNGMNFVHQSLNCWKLNSCPNTVSLCDSLSDIQKT